MFKLLRFRFVLYPTVAGRTTRLKPSVRHSNPPLSQRLSSEQTADGRKSEEKTSPEQQVAGGGGRCKEVPGGVVAGAPSPYLASRGRQVVVRPRPRAHTHTHVRDITPQPHAGGNYARGKTLVRKFLSFCVRSNRSLSTVNMFFCRMDFGR